MSWFADGMAPCVTRSSVPMRLIMHNREVLVYYEEEIQLPVSCVLSKKKKIAVSVSWLLMVWLLMSPDHQHP